MGSDFDLFMFKECIININVVTTKQKTQKMCKALQVCHPEKHLTRSTIAEYSYSIDPHLHAYRWHLLTVDIWVISLSPPSTLPLHTVIPLRHHHLSSARVLLHYQRLQSPHALDTHSLVWESVKRIERKLYSICLCGCAQSQENIRTLWPIMRGISWTQHASMYVRTLYVKTTYRIILVDKENIDVYKISILSCSSPRITTMRWTG